MSEEGWATLWLIVAIASMVGLMALFASIHFTPSYSGV